MIIIPFLDKISKPKTILLLFITSTFLATLLLTQCFGLLKVVPDATMDPLFYYSGSTFFSNLEVQGETGRQGYLQLHLLDYLFITQFYLFFALVILVLLKKIQAPEKLKLLCLLPFVSALMDFLENLSVDISILIYPHRIMFIGDVSGFFTCLKMVFLYIWFGICLILAILMIFQALRKVFSQSK